MRRVPPRVLLCVMPFLPAERPALGVSLLKAVLQENGIPCDVVYGVHRFLDRIGFPLYQEVAQFSPSHDLVGEWIFSKSAWPDLARPDIDFETYCRNRVGIPFKPAFIGQVQYARSIAGDYITQLADEICANSYDIVGFSSTFQQTLASIALAREIKVRRPEILTMIGGANCEGPMGATLLRQAPALDLAVSGEADQAILQIIQAWSGGSGYQDIEGVSYRDKDGVVVPAQKATPLVTDLNASPYPDHSDFVSSFWGSTVKLFMAPELTVETSRGCWWGQKHHCTFCGLNGNSMRFRSKSPERAAKEIRHLRASHGIDSFFCTDNIVDMGYFKTLIPDLTRDGSALQLFYEMKANLKKEQLATLRALGTTWFQPGIESLSTPILRLMRKGVRGIQNVQLLKWAKAMDFTLTWNMICGFPGEKAAFHDQMIETMKLIPHLTPPASYAAFRLDRFSPMHVSPQEFNLTDVKPYPAYELCYPAAGSDTHNLAYFFTYSSVLSEDTEQAINRAWSYSQRWRNNFGKGDLIAFNGPSFLTILDTRPNRLPQHIMLEGDHRGVYLAVDEVVSLARLAEILPIPADQIAAILGEFEEAGLVLREEDLYLGLAVMKESVPQPPAGDVSYPSFGAHRQQPLLETS
ncbi:RiPP maturation radical SAM C-methyltransferase [Bradyrhizobium diazoefficiens]|uniref:RiPP maturation radical SAM C-methyltransferase n=1 Tax=Bradyrhizobium diazoefficiens TaxID=1355477 RepID=UPI00190B71A8|nr:RiPP maturation radical SAM C-methyltransferase [Bradyrhizobium diazoefficiens]MBK3662545.1 RiPP maturation radical SAM C-methyltransferase [Bradyrhizobium diazoefficiens]